MPFDDVKQNSHPTAPVFGVVNKFAEMAPPNIRPADGIVHVPSEIVKAVAVPALPSVGGALESDQWPYLGHRWKTHDSWRSASIATVYGHLCRRGTAHGSSTFASFEVRRGCQSRDGEER